MTVERPTGGTHTTNNEMSTSSNVLGDTWAVGEDQSALS